MSRQRRGRRSAKTPPEIAQQSGVVVVTAQRLDATISSKYLTLHFVSGKVMHDGSISAVYKRIDR